MNSGIGTSHLECFQKIIENFNNVKKNIPLKAIQTLDTLKAVNMLYLSDVKKTWIINNKTIISSRLEINMINKFIENKISLKNKKIIH